MDNLHDSEKPVPPGIDEARRAPVEPPDFPTRRSQKRKLPAALAAMAVMALLFSLTTSVPASAVEGGEVVDGVDAPDWAVLIEADLGLASKSFCSGSLITPTAVLTAAHCLYNNVAERVADSELLVTVGRPNIQDDSQGVERDVIGSDSHPLFVPTPDEPANPFDLAVLHIPAVPADYEVLPVALTTPSQIPGVVLFGYGNDDLSGGLQGRVPVDRSLQLQRTQPGGTFVSDCIGDPGLPPMLFCIDPPGNGAELFPGDVGGPWVSGEGGKWLQHLVHLATESSSGEGTAASANATLDGFSNHEWIADAVGLFTVPAGTILDDGSGDYWLVGDDGNGSPIVDTETALCLIENGAPVVTASIQEIQQIPLDGLIIDCAMPAPMCIDSDGSVQSVLTNIGFETGDLSGWTFGEVTEEICVTEADSFTGPFEGDYMARLGRSQASSGISQPPGPNEMSQTFLVDEPTEAFAYNIFTYDYTGFDDFIYRVTVEDAAGTVIASFQRGAWGQSSDVSLKSSGWQYAELDLSDYIGDEVTIKISAGGTSDSLYSFWAYVDSAESGPPHLVAPITEVTSPSGSIVSDPQSGQVTVLMPGPNPTDLTITSQVVCPEGSNPTTVLLLLGGEAHPMVESPAGSGTFAATIAAGNLVSAPLSIEVACDPAGLFVSPVGGLALYDPSGIVSDADTGEPIEGATVMLYTVPGWLPGSGGAEATQCQNDGGPWVQPAPVALGVAVNPYGDEDDGGNSAIEPDVNPFLTNPDGFYGWDVAEGCWYVEVTAEGYEPLTSPVVGVPPEVTNLDLAMTPIDDGTPPPPPPLPPVDDCTEIEVTFDQAQVWNRAGFEFSSTTDVELDCMEYEVHLESIDPNHEVGYQPDQMMERWFLQGLNAAGEVIYTSSPTADLPEDMTNAVVKVGQADLTGVVSFRARHLRGSNTIDSIHARARLVPVT